MLATFSDHVRLFTSASTSPWCGRSFKITASSASCIWSIFWKRVLICTGCPSPQKGTPSAAYWGNFLEMKKTKERKLRKFWKTGVLLFSHLFLLSAFHVFRFFRGPTADIDATLMIEAQLRKKLEPRKIEPMFSNIWQERELDPEKNKRSIKKSKKSDINEIFKWWLFDIFFYWAESPGCYLPDSRPNSPKIRCFFWGPTAKALLMFGYTSCSSSFVKPRTDIWGASWQCGIICIICLPCIANDISYTNVRFTVYWCLIPLLNKSCYTHCVTGIISIMMTYHDDDLHQTEDNSCYMQLRVVLYVIEYMAFMHVLCCMT